MKSKVEKEKTPIPYNDFYIRENFEFLIFLKQGNL